MAIWFLDNLQLGEIIDFLGNMIPPNLCKNCLFQQKCLSSFRSFDSIRRQSFCEKWQAVLKLINSNQLSIFFCQHVHHPNLSHAIMVTGMDNKEYPSGTWWVSTWPCTARSSPTWTSPAQQLRFRVFEQLCKYWWYPLLGSFVCFSEMLEIII